MPVCTLCGKEGDSYAGSSRCKKCDCARVNANRAAKIDQYREYDRRRNQLPHRRAGRVAYNQTNAGLAVHDKATRRQRAISPEKYKARTAVGNAVRDGRLAKMPCEVCGISKVQAHHDDYSKPLDVRWLCQRHHREAEGRI